MRSIIGAALAGLFLTGGSAATIACSPCRVGGQDEVIFEDGDVNESRTIYQTGGPNDEMLHFPQGRTYDLMHGLGTTPVSVDLFVSFRHRLSDTADTEDQEEPNNVSPSAGNQAVIEMWNDEFVRVRNDTCAEFYLRAVVFANPDLVSADNTGAAGAPAD